MSGVGMDLAGFVESELLQDTARGEEARPRLYYSSEDPDLDFN